MAAPLSTASWRVAPSISKDSAATQARGGDVDHGARQAPGFFSFLAAAAPAPVASVSHIYAPFLVLP